VDRVAAALSSQSPHTTHKNYRLEQTKSISMRTDGIGGELGGGARGAAWEKKVAATLSGT